MEPPHPHWADHNHSDEHLNLMFTMLQQVMDSPHPYWADHNHSDEHLNLMFTMLQQVMDSPHPYWADHNHSDEHVNLIYTTVRQQRSLFLSPSPPDSGYNSPSETHSHPRGKLRVVNTTPTPPATPTPTPPLLLAEDEENQNLAARQAEEWALSSGWEISSENSEAGFARIGEEKEEKKKKKKKRKLRDYPSEKSSSNIFSRGLRRAGKCIGTAVLASGKKIWPFGAGAARGSRLRDLDGTAEDAVVTNGGEGFYKKVKRTLLLRKEEPVHLKPAKVRMMLD